MNMLAGNNYFVKIIFLKSVQNESFSVKKLSKSLSIFVEFLDNFFYMIIYVIMISMTLNATL